MENLGAAVPCPRSSDNEHWRYDESNVQFRGETITGSAPQLDKAQLAQLPTLPSNQPTDLRSLILSNAF